MVIMIIILNPHIHNVTPLFTIFQWMSVTQKIKTKLLDRGGGIQGPEPLHNLNLI